MQPPEPDWGLMVSEGRQYLQSAPWLMLFPALAISTAVIGANLFGDGLGTRLSYRGGGATCERARRRRVIFRDCGRAARVRTVGATTLPSRGMVHAVRDVSFAIRRGETFGVVGESGSGKSTLAFAVMGYLSANGRVTGGRIEYQGRDLLGMSRARLDELRGARIAMVYQDPMSSLNPSITVGDQVAEAVLAHEPGSRNEARSRTLELFGAVNMPDPAAIFRRYPHQLSGGQQQRVLIAMALACNPDLLIMDEPTTGLDVTTEAQILDLINALKARFSSAILYISHNLGVIARISDHLGVMYAGQMVEQGPVRDVFQRQLHPYTAGLLECLPKLDFGRKARSLKLIPGMIPDLTRVRPACSFEPRCPHARERCRDEAPPLIEVVPGHASRCLFWREQEEERRMAVEQPPAASPNRTTVSPGAVPLLEVDDLGRNYVDSNKLLGFFGSERVVRALDGVSLAVQANETLAIVGESGCGKTTLARCIVGLVEPTHGTIAFDGAPLAGIAGDRSRDVRRRLQMVFQNPDSTLNPRRSIGDALRRPLATLSRTLGRCARRAAVELLARGPAGRPLSRPLAEPAQRRRKAACRHCARVRNQSRPHRVRRARIGARRFRAGRDPEPAGRVAGARSHGLRLHLARHERRTLSRRSRRRAVPGAASAKPAPWSRSSRRRITRTPRRCCRRSRCPIPRRRSIRSVSRARCRVLRTRRRAARSTPVARASSARSANGRFRPPRKQPMATRSCATFLCPSW